MFKSISIFVTFGLLVTMAQMSQAQVVRQAVVCGVGYVKEFRLNQRTDGQNWTNFAVVIDSSGFKAPSFPPSDSDFLMRENKRWIHLDYSTANSYRAQNMEWDGTLGQLYNAFVSRLPVFIVSHKPNGSDNACNGYAADQKITTTVCRAEDLCNKLVSKY
ncbi:MAG: hypothetical protein JKY11_06630 [Alphaproteobacteria bacterium]|nr:hypothetical protein [Alphaproteobacteria bacterium]